MRRCGRAREGRPHPFASTGTYAYTPSPPHHLAPHASRPRPPIPIRASQPFPRRRCRHGRRLRAVTRRPVCSAGPRSPAEAPAHPHPRLRPHPDPDRLTPPFLPPAPHPIPAYPSPTPLPVLPLPRPSPQPCPRTQAGASRDPNGTRPARPPPAAGADGRRGLQRRGPPPPHRRHQPAAGPPLPRSRTRARARTHTHTHTHTCAAPSRPLQSLSCTPAGASCKWQPVGDPMADCGGARRAAPGPAGAGRGGPPANGQAALHPAPGRPRPVAPFPSRRPVTRARAHADTRTWL